MRNLFVSLLLLLASAATAAAQITVPFPAFTAGTTIQPDEVNDNFAKFGDALNRTGGTMTGSLTTRDVFPDSHNARDLGLTGTRFRDAFFGRNVDVGGTFGATGAATLGSTLAVTGAVTFSSTLGVSGAITARDLLPQSTATYDVGVTGTRWRDGFFSRNVDIGGTLGATGAATFGSTLAVGSTGAAALDVAGGAQFGSGNVSLIGTDGRLTALSSTTLANLSGANLTGLDEANITDGSILARVAGDETVTGTWTVSALQPTWTLSESDGALNNKRWRATANGEAFFLQAIEDSTTIGSNFMTVQRTGTTVDSIAFTTPALTTSGTLGVGGGTAVASIITGTATWDIPSKFNNSMESTTVTVTGVQTTSPCMVGFYPNEAGTPVNGLLLSANYSSANTVRVVAYNVSGSTIDPASATVRVTCFTY